MSIGPAIFTERITLDFKKRTGRTPNRYRALLRSGAGAHEDDRSR